MMTLFAAPRQNTLRYRVLGLIASAPLLALGAGCGDNDTGSGMVANTCDTFDTANCIEVAGGDSAALLTAVNSLDDDTTVILGAGTFVLTNTVQIRGATGVNLVGQGIEQTILSFTGAAAQTNGIDVVGDDFLVQDLTVVDAPKDGIRVENSDGITFRRIRATWTTPGLSSNGAYGIYPVRSRNVLVEDSIGENASDAGLYVGQCMNVVVRNNTVTGNVAGLEIENTQYADVYGNTAENNTSGILVLDLPGNPIVGRDVRLHDNIIRNNNFRNFAPGGTVREIPPGTGTFILASRRVEVVDNTFTNNRSFDVAVLSGLIIAPNRSRWEIATSDAVGDWDDLGLDAGETMDTVTNFRSENIVIARNTHSVDGELPPRAISPMFAVLMVALYGTDPSDNVIYDTIGESMFDAEVPANNSNDNHLCLGGNAGGTFASINALAQLESPGQPFLQIPTAPFAPFDCTELEGGDLVLWNPDAP